MRLLALAGALGLAVIAVAPSVTPAAAGPYGPRFCLQYRGGGENCGFYSFNQCLAALSGNAGMCMVAPWQTTVTTVSTPRGRYRVIRDAID
ncbi:MAG: hypothetical protein QOG38_1345 [Hyphomicrobiales bacterium]|jgi:hypothetical protein|nr:hypothetical protein [Hyphomicrobiales bacterium]